MPLVTCPECRAEQVVSRDLAGLEVRCRECGVPFAAADRTRQAARKPDNPTAAYVLAGVVGAFVGGLILGFCGLVLSQYAPVFGDFWEKSVAQPWSPARMGLIPIHLFVFGLLGVIGGGGAGVVVCLVYRSNKRTRR